MMVEFFKGRLWKVIIAVALFVTCHAWTGEAAEQNVDQKLEDYVGQLEVSVMTRQHKAEIFQNVEEFGSTVLGFHSKTAAEIVEEVLLSENTTWEAKLLEKLELSKYKKLSYLNNPEVEVHNFLLIVAKDEKTLKEKLS